MAYSHTPNFDEKTHTCRQICGVGQRHMRFQVAGVDLPGPPHPIGSSVELLRISSFTSAPDDNNAARGN